MHLYIIRHCQSENNALWRRTGSDHGRSSDPALTPLGHKQAQFLAQYLAEQNKNGKSGPATKAGDQDYGITHLYCSLMLRSIQTGIYISEALGLPLLGHAEIHERGGIYLKNPYTLENEGLPGPDRSHFQAHHPQLVLPETLGNEGWWNRDYEELEVALQRARRFLIWLEKKHGDKQDRVAIISHGGFIQALFAELLGASFIFENDGLERQIWIRINNGSLCRIEFWPDGIRLAYLNRVEFFPPELIS